MPATSSTAILRTFLEFQCCQSGAAVAVDVVAKFGHKVCSGKDLPHNITLVANALAVNDADFPIAKPPSFQQVLLDGRFHFFGAERVQIELASQRDDERIVTHG